MRAVNDRFDAVPSRHLADSFNWRDLSREIDLMSNLNQTGLRRNRAFKRRGDFIDVLWRHGNLNQIELDSFPALTLPNCSKHARIILRGRQHFISRLQVQSE